MRGSLDTRDPTTVTAQLGMLAASGATGSYRTDLLVRIPFNATSTLNAATNWINPEASTVCAQPFLVVRTAGSAGTFFMGRSSDGTGSSNAFIGAGTLTAGVHYPSEILGTVAASATVGGVNILFLLIGPGGTGTNNSIVVQHNDQPSASSTAVGELLVRYFLVT